MSDGCGAPGGGIALADVTVSNEAVVQGRVVHAGSPVERAYARLLDTSGEFAGEVPTSEEGIFRFFAAPGRWTVRVIAPGGVTVDREVETELGAVTEVEIALDG